MKNSTTRKRYRYKNAILCLLSIALFAIAGCYREVHPGGPTPELELRRNEFYVSCEKIYGGAIGTDFGALFLMGYIKNNSTFRVKLDAAYKGSHNQWYHSFADHSHNFRPIANIYLNPGEEIYGRIMYLSEQSSINVPTSIPKQTYEGLFRVDAYPVDDNNQLLPDGNRKKYIIPIPRPEGFIEDQFGNYQCPCFSLPQCGNQTQPVHGRDGW